jgi:hypothetical protein
MTKRMVPEQSKPSRASATTLNDLIPDWREAMHGIYGNGGFAALSVAMPPQPSGAILCELVFASFC